MEQKVRVWLETPSLPTGKTAEEAYPDYDAKYDFAVYPSSYGLTVSGIGNAISTNNFYLLDPVVNLTDGLTAHYDFETGSGTVLEDLIGVNDFAMSSITWNGTSYPTYNNSGDGSNYSIQFDGVSDEGISNIELITVDADYSICGWLYTPNATPTAIFLSQMQNSVRNKWDFLIKIVDGRLLFEKRTADASTDADETGGAITENAWVQWCAVYDESVGLDGSPDYLDGALTLYIDGVFANNTVTDQNLNGWATAEVEIGFPVATVEFEGKLDELKVYDRALNATEVSVMYNSDLEPPCVEDWVCDGYETTCTITELLACNSVNDLNICGNSYTGNYSEFTPNSCVFVSESEEDFEAFGLMIPLLLLMGLIASGTFIGAKKINPELAKPIGTIMVIMIVIVALTVLL